MRASALVHGLAILDLLETQEPRRFGELRQATGVSEPTLSAILKLLEDAQLIRRVDTGYGIGRRGLMLARAFFAANDLTRLARPAMRCLRAELDCRIELGEPQGCAYLVLDVCPGPDDPPLHAALGQTIHHLVGTAPAKICLAHLSTSQRQAYYASDQFYQPTPHTLRDVAAIEAQLDAIRRQGYAEDHEEGRVGIVRLSASVLDRLGNLVGCLSAVLHATEADAQRIARCANALTVTAAALSNELGYEGAPHD